MPDLATFQSSFLQALLTGRHGAERQPPAMAVYQNSWRKALVEALEANYPVAARLVGEEAFRALALEFIRGRGAPSPVLADFGNGFPTFLRDHSISEGVPYLAEVARIERLSTEAHVAPDATSMPLAKFIERAEHHAGSQLRLHPAARFCWLETPALTIWQAHQDPSFEGFAPEWRPESALVHRPRAVVTVEPLDRGAYALLDALRSGASLEDALGRAEKTAPEMDTSTTLVRLAAAGTFLDFHVTEE